MIGIFPWICLFEHLQPFGIHSILRQWIQQSKWLLDCVKLLWVSLPFDNFIQYPLVLVLKETVNNCSIFTLLLVSLPMSDVFSRLTNLFISMLNKSCSLPLIIFLPYFVFSWVLLLYFIDGRGKRESNMT